MINFHDPTRQEICLQQCLSNNKKPIAILLGAGAPMAIKDTSGACLIPDIKELTRHICTEFSTHTTLKDSFKKVCDFYMDLGITEPNIEQLLSHIRNLNKIVGMGNVNGLNSSTLCDLDKEICRIINGIVNRCLPDSKTPYHKIAAWVNAISRTAPIELFTTNYDLLMEQALEDLHVSYFDGFSGSRFTFFDIASIEDDKLPTRWARLWKLHGSVNWFIDKEKHIYRSYKPYSDDDVKIIHPSNMKYDESRKMPYLAMIDRLSKFIKQSSSLLLTCGYSYRDEHINDIIIQALQSNPTSIVYGLLHGNIDNYPDAIRLAEGCPNFSLLAQDQAIIGTQKLPWTVLDQIGSGTKSTNAVTWAEDVTSNKTKSTFKLGNFSSLGDFFIDIIGSYNEGEKNDN